MSAGLLIAIISGIAVWVYMRIYSPLPEFHPLLTSPVDPLMIGALEKSKESIPEFLTLLNSPHENALVKLSFVSSTNEVEYLWAEVIGVVGKTELDVNLVTPPVTHSGHLERRYVCNVEDIVDWQLFNSEGKICGGFTQRAMFAIARRDGVKLPKKLLKWEREYADS